MACRMQRSTPESKQARIAKLLMPAERPADRLRRLPPATLPSSQAPVPQRAGARPADCGQHRHRRRHADAGEAGVNCVGSRHAHHNGWRHHTFVGARLSMQSLQFSLQHTPTNLPCTPCILQQLHVPALRSAQIIINCGALPCLLNLLTTSHKKSIKKEACWTISNITAGTKEQIQVRGGLWGDCRAAQGRCEGWAAKDDTGLLQNLEPGATTPPNLAPARRLLWTRALCRRSSTCWPPPSLTSRRRRPGCAAAGIAGSSVCTAAAAAPLRSC